MQNCNLQFSTSAIYAHFHCPRVVPNHACAWAHLDPWVMPWILIPRWYDTCWNIFWNILIHLVILLLLFWCPGALLYAQCFIMFWSLISLLWRSFLLFHGGDVTCFDVMKLLVGWDEVICGKPYALTYLANLVLYYCHYSVYKIIFCRGYKKL